METKIKSSYYRKNGRFYFSVIGLGLNHKQLLDHIFNNKNYKVTHTYHRDWIGKIIQNYYDDSQRLEKGKVYNIVIIPTKELEEKHSNCTSEDLKAMAIKDYGNQSVSELKDELIFLIREKFSNKEMVQMGFYEISTLSSYIDNKNLILRGIHGMPWTNSKDDSYSFISTAKYTDPLIDLKINSKNIFLQKSSGVAFMIP